METRDCEYLLAVQQQGSISRAAEALGISQPALTKAIRRIEAQAGLPLFERTASGVVPTQAGILFMARARKIALEYEDAVKEMRALRSGEQGVLRLGYSPTVPSELVLGACHQLLVERPAARLKMRRRLARDLMDLLAAGELDLIVVPIPREDIGAVSVEPLFHDRLAVHAHEAHPLCRRHGLTLADLAGEEWLLPGPNILLRQQVEAAFRQRGLPAPSLRVETDHASIALLQLLRGTSMLCIAGADSPQLMRELRALELAPGELDLDRHIGAIFRSSGYFPPLAQRVVQLLRERAG
jgi:DNA-binding transcriptional LysR family regulator